MNAGEWVLVGAVLPVAVVAWALLYLWLRPKTAVPAPAESRIKREYDRIRPPSVDDDPTEYVVREPAIYTDRDPTVPVNIRQPQPWEWAK